MVNHRIVALSNQLRQEGINVSIRSTQTACDVWQIMKHTDNTGNLKTALKSVYIKDHHDNEKFNKVYDELFHQEESDKLKQIRKNNNLSDDNIIKPEDIMGKATPTKTQITLEDIIPEEINPEILKEKRIKEQDILQADITRINKFDERILTICRKLGKKIANKRIKKQKKSQKRNINIQKTIRKNLKNGGKLIQPEYRKPHVNKTKHIFLNDVSGSCDWISSWFFSIIYGCQRSFNKITTYEFDNKIVDVTKSLNTESFYKSYENIISKRIEHGMLHGQTDMTNTFRQILKKAPLNHKTDLIILTDCRDWKSGKTQEKPESAELLEKIVQKSRKVIIFNPEPEKQWHTSNAHEYMKAGAQIYEIKNLKNLSGLIEKL